LRQSIAIDPSFVNPLTSGVGQYPYSFAPMGGPNCGRRYNLPFRIVPDGGKVAKHSFKSQPNESCDVLNECVLRSKYANDSMEFPPETRTLSVNAGHAPRVANVLAWEPSDNNINSSKVVLSDGSNIFKPLRVGKVTLQHLAAIRINLYLPDGFESGTFKAEFNSSYAGEQTTDRKTHFSHGGLSVYPNAVQYCSRLSHLPFTASLDPPLK